MCVRALVVFHHHPQSSMYYTFFLEIFEIIRYIRRMDTIDTKNHQHINPYDIRKKKYQEKFKIYKEHQIHRAQSFKPIHGLKSKKRAFSSKRKSIKTPNTKAHLNRNQQSQSWLCRIAGINLMFFFPFSLRWSVFNLKYFRLFFSTDIYYTCHVYPNSSTLPYDTRALVSLNFLLVRFVSLLLSRRCRCFCCCLSTRVVASIFQSFTLHVIQSGDLNQL